MFGSDNFHVTYSSKDWMKERQRKRGDRKTLSVQTLNGALRGGSLTHIHTNPSLSCLSRSHLGYLILCFWRATDEPGSGADIVSVWSFKLTKYIATIKNSQQYRNYKSVNTITLELNNKTNLKNVLGFTLLPWIVNAADALSEHTYKIVTSGIKSYNWTIYVHFLTNRMWWQSPHRLQRSILSQPHC